MRRLAMVAVVLLICVGAADAAEVRLVVTGGKVDAVNVPLSAAIAVPEDLKAAVPDGLRVAMKSADGSAVAGQITVCPCCGTKVCWIAPKVPAGRKQTWTATLRKGSPASGGFGFKDTKGKHLDLLLGGRRVTRYMYARDTSTAAAAHATYKVYTHVFDEDGTAPITKGPGGRYTHHRGIFLGYSRLGYDGGKRSDWWHMKNVTQEHQKFLALKAGPVLGASAMEIHWLDGAGKPVVVEQRRQIVYRQPAPAIMLFEFRSTLTAARSDVDLNGDPEHAGFQYRPANEVNTKATRYLFPTDRITAGNVKREVDLPWAAECYELGGKKYTVQHMNHLSNPKGTKYSAYRDYGRFGTFAKAKIAKGESLTLRHRIWVAAGEQLDRDAMQARAAAFVDPPKVEAQ